MCRIGFSKGEWKQGREFWWWGKNLCRHSQRRSLPCRRTTAPERLEVCSMIVCNTSSIQVLGTYLEFFYFRWSDSQYWICKMPYTKPEWPKPDAVISASVFVRWPLHISQLAFKPACTLRQSFWNGLGLWRWRAAASFSPSTLLGLCSHSDRSPTAACGFKTSFQY